MFFYPDELLDRLLADDAPLGDLTTRSLGIGDEAGRMTFMPCRAGRISGLSVSLTRLASRWAHGGDTNTPLYGGID